MSEPTPKLATQVSEEFFVKVNDFIQMANRIEKRFDTGHAQLAMLHAISRYSAHHYLSTVKQDSEQERKDFAAYIGNQLAGLTLHHIAELSGAPAAAGEAAQGDAAAE